MVFLQPFKPFKPFKPFILFWKIIGSGFGAGYSPIAPGTAGALVALLFLVAHVHLVIYGCFGGYYVPLGFLLPLIFIFFFLGKIACDKLEPLWGHDPSKIVVDEMVGMWIAMLLVPFDLLNTLLAFILFRIFDIWKPLGIRKMEKLKGGWGVMMDDVLAGVYSLIILHLYLFLTSDIPLK